MVYTKQIEKLQEELESIGLYVKNYYFLSETFYNRNSDEKPIHGAQEEPIYQAS